MSNRISIKIDAKGNPTVLDATGFGSTCGSALAKFEELVGTANESTREQTAAYSEQTQDNEVSQ